MAQKLYKKLISAMSYEGVCNASDVDISASLNNQSYSKVSAIITAIISFISGLRETLSNLVSTGLKREIVQVLPTENPSETTIYLILKDPAGTSGDIYDEYMYINNAWEHIGSTEVDLSNYVQKPSNTSDGKQYVMRNGQWEEVQIATDAANITYSGDVTGADNVKAAIDALVPDATIARQLKEAIGSEVGEQATATIANGSIVFHDGRFYRLTNDVYEGDRWGIEIGAVSTTLSDEINALRGVSSESVYLTIQPTSAIPQAGVTARIYNIKTQSFMTERTILPSANRVHLGDVPFGDDYTIIMPSIDGYIQPADQTFKASQMIRERTVTYVADSSAEYETVTIKATKSNSAAIGECSVTVSVYDGNGNVVQTITLNLEGGQCESFTLPFGTKYRITYPDISGFLTPRSQVWTAALPVRNLSGRYILIPSSAYKIVTTDFDYVEMDADLTDLIAQNKILGIAYMSSTLLTGNGAFIYVLPNVSYNGTAMLASATARQTAQKWTSVNIDCSNANYQYDGLTNCINAAQTIAQYEEDNGVTINSVIKDWASANPKITVNGQDYQYFIPTNDQYRVFKNSISSINAVFEYYGKSSLLSDVGQQFWSSRNSGLTNAYWYNQYQTSSTGKTANNMQVQYYLPIINNV